MSEFQRDFFPGPLEFRFTVLWHVNSKPGAAMNEQLNMSDGAAFTSGTPDVDVATKIWPPADAFTPLVDAPRIIDSRYLFIEFLE